jgi:hypothetical protein
MSTNESTSSSRAGVLLRARWAIRLTTCLMAVAGIVSLGFFAYQVQCRDPISEIRYRDQPGAWLHLAGHLLRGVVGLWLFVMLLRYLRELGNLKPQPNPDYEPLIRATARGWNAIGWCSIAMVGYAVVAIIASRFGPPVASRFGPPVASKFGPPGFSTSASSNAPRFKLKRQQDAIKIELREADFDPRDGLMESSMIVIEPVRKPVYVGKEPIIGTNDIARATADVDEAGRPALSLKLTKQGASKLQIATTALIGHQIAIMIDDKILAVPKLLSPLSKSLMITGDFTGERVKYIADSINGTE